MSGPVTNAGDAASQRATRENTKEDSPSLVGRSYTWFPLAGLASSTSRLGIAEVLVSTSVATGDAESEEPSELLICNRNWKVARDNPTVLAELIEKELSEGYLKELSLESAQQRWDHVAGYSAVNLRLSRLIFMTALGGPNRSDWWPPADADQHTRKELRRYLRNPLK